MITPGEEGKAFDALKGYLCEGGYSESEALLEALRERFEQLSNEMDERKRIEQLEEQVEGLEEQLEEARNNLRRLCALAIGCQPNAVDLEPKPPKFRGDVDNACDEIDELRTFHQTWHEALDEAEIYDPDELVNSSGGAAEFLRELAAQLGGDNPIEALAVHLGRHDPATGGAIIPNAWHMSAQQLAYELANL